MAPGIPYDITRRGSRRQETFPWIEDEVKEFRRYERGGRPPECESFVLAVKVKLGRALR